jgi:hypothetical protein
MLRKTLVSLGILTLLVAPLWAATEGLTKGSVQLKSAGPLAFGPDGILFVADPQAAAIYAVATGDTSGNPEDVQLNVSGLDKQIAAALGTTPREILINDLAVNPLSGNVYLSVSRGRAPDAGAALLRITSDGQLSEVALKNVDQARAELPNAPAADAVGRRNESLRAESITDLEYLDGQLLVAGLSTEEFASTLRSIPFPFSSVSPGTGVEIFHGAHGRFETASPVRTFATYEIKSEPHLLAAYTCTPLVRFPLSELKPGSKVKGTTVAELGNRNRPLDMVIYNKGGKDYILMANSARGVMKIGTEDIDRSAGITEPVGGGGTAGQKYETIADLAGIEQLARLNDGHAIVLQKSEDGSLQLKTIALP